MRALYPFGGAGEITSSGEGRHMAVGAVDIGGTKIAVGISDGDGKLLAKERMSSRHPGGPTASLDWVTQSLKSCQERAGISHLTAIGVGCCGPVDSRLGRVLNPPNLPGWTDVPLVAVMSDLMDVPTFLENDANAAALGELQLGAGRGARDLLYVTISTGIGGGIIAGGQLVRGIRDSAGEIGHQTVNRSGPRCPCGSRGCLEAYASGPAIARRAQEAMRRAKRKGRLLGLAGGHAAKISAEHVVAAAREGDALARGVWEETLDWLAIGLGNTLTTLAPERLIIGGGVALAGEEMLFQPLRERLRAWARLLPLDRVQVLPAANIADAGLMGAVAVALSATRALALEA